MHSQIPVRPFGESQRPALLGREHHQRIVQVPGFLQQAQNLADLPVEIRDLGEISRRGLARARIIVLHRGERDLGGIELRGVPGCPRGVGVVGAEEQAERLLGVFRHEVADAVPGGEAFYILKREHRLRAGVFLA